LCVYVHVYISYIIFQICNTLANIISEGLMVIANCSDTSSLRPALKEQTLADIYHYVDPWDNFFNHVLLVICIIEKIHPQNNLHNQLFSEEFLKSVASMLGSMHYNETVSLYLVDTPCGYAGIEIENYLLCLLRFAKQEDYQCYFVTQWQAHGDQIDTLLSNGTDLEIERMKRLLGLLTGHSCGTCSCMFLMELLLKHGIHIESPKPETPKESTKTATGPKPSSAATTSPTFSCKYMQQCHHFLQTLHVKGNFITT
jgi:hypothetical protein